MTCGTCSTYDEMRNTYNISVGESEGKEHLERPWNRSEDTIKMDNRVIICEYVNWTHLVQNRDQWLVLVNTIINFGFHRRRGIWQDERLSSSQEGLYSIQLLVSSSLM